MVTISRLVTTFFLFPFYTHTYKYIHSYNVVRKMLTFEDKWKLDDNRRKDTRKDYRGKIEIVMLKRI